MFLRVLANGRVTKGRVPPFPIVVVERVLKTKASKSSKNGHTLSSPNRCFAHSDLWALSSEPRHMWLSIFTSGEFRPPQLLGVRSLSLQRETSTDVLANLSRELANFKREFAKLREWPRYCRKVYWIKMVQNGPKWSKRPFWSKWPYSELDFSIHEAKLDQNGPFWSILAEN